MMELSQPGPRRVYCVQDTYPKWSNTTEDEFRRLSKREQDSLKHRLNVRITETLKHWFPDTACLDQVDYSDVFEWQTESDVHEAMLDWLVEKGYATVSG